MPNKRPAEGLASRLTYCRKMLYIHNVLTDAENNKAKGRLAKIKGGGTPTDWGAYLCCGAPDDRPHMPWCDGSVKIEGRDT